MTAMKSYKAVQSTESSAHVGYDLEEWDGTGVGGRRKRRGCLYL